MRFNVNFLKIYRNGYFQPSRNNSLHDGDAVEPWPVSYSVVAFALLVFVESETSRSWPSLAKMIPRHI